jgi:imidazolonepropionase-like amidohydrolase
MSPIMPLRRSAGCAGHRTQLNSVQFLAFIVTCVGLLTPILSAAETRGRTLLSNVRVVQLPEGRVTGPRDVLVSEGRISAIGEHGTMRIRDARFVDGRGGYVMPGLAEGHAHVPGPKQKQYAEDVLLLYLAHGVTTIRGMLGDPWHLELRERLARGEVLGPRLYTAGPSINGRSAPTAEVATRMVREQAAARYDFLKLHPGLTVEVFDALVDASRAAGITLQGHVSQDVGVARALDARQRAIDHLDGYVEALAKPGCEAAQGIGVFGLGLAQCADESRIGALAMRTRAAGTWMVPTQVLIEQWAAPPTSEALRARPALRYMPAPVIAQWMERHDEFVAAHELAPDRAARFIAIRRALIREMHAAGVPILLGSDAPQVFNVPGDSALEELRLYVDIGLTPAEALATGTVNVARFFGAKDRLGQVREGFEADLLLLEANPLEDVRALRKLAGVMVRGRWLDAPEVRERLEALARRAVGSQPTAHNLP